MSDIWVLFNPRKVAFLRPNVWSAISKNVKRNAFIRLSTFRRDIVRQLLQYGVKVLALTSGDRSIETDTTKIKDKRNWRLLENVFIFQAKAMWVVYNYVHIWNWTVMIKVKWSVLETKKLNLLLNTIRYVYVDAIIIVI